MDTVRCAACMMPVFSRLSGISRAGVFSNLVQRDTCPLFLLPVLPWSISGLCLELGTEVGGTGIVQPIGYFVEGQFTVIQQFLGAFDFLGDKVFFDGRALRFGEQLAERTVIVAALRGEVLR